MIRFVKPCINRYAGLRLRIILNSSYGIAVQSSAADDTIAIVQIYERGPA